MGEELYKIGESFLKDDASEAELRTAINRLYYGVMHIVVSKMIEKNYEKAEELHDMLSKEGGYHNPHEIVCNYYDKTKSKIMFRSIRNLRGWADYNLSVPLSKVKYTNASDGKKEWDIPAIKKQFDIAKSSLPKYFERRA